MFQLVLLISILQLSLFAQSEKGTIYALILGDTLDKDIGESCVPDVYRMNKSIQTIANQLNKFANVTILDGEKCSVDQVRGWFINAHIRKNDILLFHYAGHGKKDANSSSWPLLTLRWGEISGSKILDYASKKHARLAVVLFASD